MSSLDFTLLLSPDNASRKAAEATFDAARQSHPQVVAAQLITTLNMPGDPATQELCAVLARRYLPAMFDLTYLSLGLLPITYCSHRGMVATAKCGSP